MVSMAISPLIQRDEIVQSDNWDGNAKKLQMQGAHTVKNEE